MTLADGFSRLPNRKTKEEIKLNVRVDFVQFSTEKLTQIHQATKADPILCELRETIPRGWPNTFREISKNLPPYWSYRDELAIENGILMKSGCIIIPTVMHPEILQKSNMVIREWKNVSCEPKAAFFGTTLIRKSTQLCKDVFSLKNNRYPNMQNP